MRWMVTKCHRQNKETSEKKERINCEQGQYVMFVWAPVKEGEVERETERVLKGSRFAILATEDEAHQGFTRPV